MSEQCGKCGSGKSLLLKVVSQGQMGMGLARSSFARLFEKHNVITRESLCSDAL